jgi:hypothetical protein
MSFIGETTYLASGTPATEDETGYEAMSMDELGSVISRGELGDTHEDQSATLIKTGRTDHDNGAKDGGVVAFEIDGEDFNDAGLALVEAGNGTSTNYSFKVAGPNQVRYFYGVIRNLKVKQGDASTKAGVMFEVAINSGITRVAAA